MGDQSSGGLRAESMPMTNLVAEHSRSPVVALNSFSCRKICHKVRLNLGIFDDTYLGRACQHTLPARIQCGSGALPHTTLHLNPRHPTPATITTFLQIS